MYVDWGVRTCAEVGGSPEAVEEKVCMAHCSIILFVFNLHASTATATASAAAAAAAAVSAAAAALACVRVSG